MFALANAQAGQPQGNEQKGDPLAALYWLSVVHSNCIIVFLRTGFGQEALGIRGLLAFVLLLACLAGDPFMVWWLIAFLVAVVIQRIVTHRAITRGAAIHSLYAGTSLLMKLPFMKNRATVIALEMILCFLFGPLLMVVNEFMGGFLMLGFVTLMIRTGIEDRVSNRRLQRMRDAQLEGRWYGDRMR